MNDVKNRGNGIFDKQSAETIKTKDANGFFFLDFALHLYVFLSL